MNSIAKKILPLIAVSILLVVSINPVFASSTVGDSLPPVSPTSVPDEDIETPIKDRAINFLENAYEKSGKLVEHVGTDLDRTENIEERVTRAIERQEEMGEDTSEVQTALSDFLAKVPDLEADYDEAVTLYETHAGFDSNGKVTDMDEAADTIQDLKELLLTTHRNWHSSVYELREVLEAYRDAHSQMSEK